MANLQASVVLDLVDRISRPVRRVRGALQELRRRSGLDQVAQAGRRVGDAFGHTVATAGRLTRRLALMGGAAVGLGWSLNRLVKGFTDPADMAVKLSRRVSATHEEIQLLAGAAQRMAGMLPNELGQNLERFDRRVAEAAANTGEAAKAYQYLGIDVQDANGRIRPSMDIMREVSDSMRDLEDPAMRMRVAYALFGRSGADMINVLQDGSDALEEQMRIFERTGQVVSEEAAKEAEKYNDNLDELRGTILGLRNDVVAELLPALNDWILRMAELIQTDRDDILGNIRRGLRQFWDGLQDVAAAILWLKDLMNGWRNLALLVAAVIGGPLILSVVNLTLAVFSLIGKLTGFVSRVLPMVIVGLTKLGALLLAGAKVALPAAIAGVKALGVALLATPVGWITLAVAAIAGLVYLIYRNWDRLAEWFGGLWERVKAWFGQGMEGISQDILAWTPGVLLGRVIDEIFELFGARPLTEMGREWIGGLWDGIRERFTAMTRWLTDRLAGLTEWMPDWARERLGLGELGAPPAMGEPALGEDRPALGGGETRVGGELRISIDQDGQPRVRSLRADGPMDFDVDTGMGMLGVAP